MIFKLAILNIAEEDPFIVAFNFDARQRTKEEKKSTLVYPAASSSKPFKLVKKDIRGGKSSVSI